MLADYFDQSKECRKKTNIKGKRIWYWKIIGKNHCVFRQTIQCLINACVILKGEYGSFLGVLIVGLNLSGRRRLKMKHKLETIMWNIFTFFCLLISSQTILAQPDIVPIVHSITLLGGAQNGRWIAAKKLRQR